jgi:hypothetical protein
MVLALSINAALLVGVILLIFSREGRSYGQVQLPAPTSNIVIMPGQLSPNTWGCYVMDSANQTLTVYQYTPGDHDLRLAAARDIQYDRKLGDFNTSPPPTDIRKMIERAEEPARLAPTTVPSPETLPR